MQRILFVGNDPDLLAAVRGLHETADLEIEVAAGGVDAVRRARRRRFELVITSPASSIEEDAGNRGQFSEIRGCGNVRRRQVSPDVVRRIQASPVKPGSQNLAPPIAILKSARQ